MRNIRFPHKPIISHISLFFCAIGAFTKILRIHFYFLPGQILWQNQASVFHRELSDHAQVRPRARRGRGGGRGLHQGLRRLQGQAQTGQAQPQERRSLRPGLPGEGRLHAQGQANPGRHDAGLRHQKLVRGQHGSHVHPLRQDEDFHP